MAKTKKPNVVLVPTEEVPSGPKPYNPLDKHNLAVSVADALLASPIHPLPPPPFFGAGIYALYYKGAYAPYARLAKRCGSHATKVPIYVGEAIPEGGRKGGLNYDGPVGRKLYGRIREHARSIDAAENLDVRDFFCQYLVVDDIWISLGENMLIERFKPVWNHFLDGFGNHAVGSGRDKSQRSSWDMLHPGRAWAGRLKAGPKAQAELAQFVEETLSRQFPK